MITQAPPHELLQSPKIELQEIVVASPIEGPWDFCYMDSQGRLFLQSCANHYSIYCISDIAPENARGKEHRLITEKYPVITSVEALGSVLVATLSTGEVFIGANELEHRADLGISRGGSLHKTADNGWWLIDGGSINRFIENYQYEILMPADSLNGGIICKSVAPTGELLLTDAQGILYTISSDGLMVHALTLPLPYASSCGFTQYGSLVLVCRSDGVLVLGSRSAELTIDAPPMDRPIWRPFVFFDELRMVNMRAGRVFRCALALPPELRNPPAVLLKTERKLVPTSSLVRYASEHR